MKDFSLPRHQAGVALVAVLMFLILIMIVGAIAVRQGSADLGVATGDQVNALSLNTADSALAYIEQSAGDPSHPNHATALSNLYGVFGYFLVDPQSKIGHQISACYRPNAQRFFDRTQGRILIPPSGTQGSGGICDPSDPTNYVSGRNTAMNQIVVVGDVDDTSDNFEDATLGTSRDSSLSRVNPYVVVNSIALLPSLSSVGDRDIVGCLARPAGDASLFGGQENINTCLQKIGAPNRILVEEGRLVEQNSGGYDDKSGSVIDACANDTACKQASGI